MEDSFVTQNSLVSLAYAEIKKDIMEDRLKPGNKIIIRELCDRYNISSTPIKQALNRLLMEGLVESIPRRGMWVKKVTWSEISDILDLRLMMDLYFIETVITTVNEDMNIRKKLQENIKENTKHAKNSANLIDFQRVYQLDQEFHGLYLKCAKNEKAIQIFNSLNTHTYSTYLFRKQPHYKIMEGIQEHEKIFDSLCEKNEEKAKKYLKLHSRNAKEIIYDTLKKANSI